MDLSESAEVSIHSDSTESYKTFLTSSKLTSLETQSTPNSLPSRRSRNIISVKSRIASLERKQFTFLPLKYKLSIMENPIDHG